MRRFLSLIFFLTMVILPFLMGCASPKRAYRDPITYSFEAETPPPASQLEWQNIEEKIKETTKKIQEWEKKHLW